VVVVTHPDFRKRTQAILERTLALIPEVRGSAIDGGAERTDSVRNGLTALADASHQAGGGGERILVAIHDGVRPLIRQTRIMAAVASAAEHGSGVCAVPVKSSLREKRADGSSHAIDRSSIYHVQTPQIFRLPEILHAYAKTEGQIFTDDASVFEAAGYPVHIVPGDYDNLKITTPEDLILAEQYLDLQRKG
jgi:2-C-methyl-D-erythritol 4-phosphate cytidylyltransferase